MGGKNSKSNLPTKYFQPQEEEKVLAYFNLKNRNEKIIAANLKNQWQNIVVTDLLDKFINYLVKNSGTADGNITVNTMALVYMTFVRGTLDEIAAIIAELNGCTMNSNKEMVISYNHIIKYVKDLMSSYLKLMEYNRDKILQSWSSGNRRLNSTSQSAVVNAWCAELIHDDDEVTFYNLELWLSHIGVVTQVGNLLVSAMFNLHDSKTSLIPRADLPTPKTLSMLDLSQIIYLNSLLPSEYRSKWRFLFSTATHGESFATMMGNITHQGPTLLIVRDTDLYTFGGFASHSWIPGPKFVGNETCFLFKLTPETNLFSSTCYNEHYMYVNCNQSSLPNGLGMGGQFGYWGLWLDHQFGLGECSESCTTYRNYVMLSAKKTFNIERLEIWGVGDPPPTPAELGERGSSVLDKDPTVTQMLEMIGRKQHSKGLRESPGRVKPMFPAEDQDIEETSDEQ